MAGRDAREGRWIRRGLPRAHSQAKTLDELHDNLREVIEMLLEDGEPDPEVEFVGVRQVMVP